MFSRKMYTPEKSLIIEQSSDLLHYYIYLSLNFKGEATKISIADKTFVAIFITSSCTTLALLAVTPIPPDM